MNKDNAVIYYLQQVPELQKRFMKQCEEYFIDDSDGAHVVWSIGLMPCIVELIADYKNNQDMLKRSFQFFEEMAVSDEDTKELLLYSVLETLGDDKKILEISRTMMGKETLQYSEAVESFLGR